ncbi:MAG: hypothetical protein WBW03_24035 [Silvibacterium sp.]
MRLKRSPLKPGVWLEWGIPTPFDPDTLASVDDESRDRPMSDWFARPVLFVTDVARSVDFYVNQLD